MASSAPTRIAPTRTAPTRGGRHRESVRLPVVATLRDAVRGPVLLRSAALASVVLGLVTALLGVGTPGGAQALLISTADQSAAPGPAVTAAAVAVPGHAEAYGEIGFGAVAKPKPTPTPTQEPSPSESAEPAGSADNGDSRTEDAASRSGGIRTSGLAEELGLSQNGLVVLNALRDTFPGVDSFGGYRPGDMDHGSGNAVDAMVSSRSLGDEIASYVQANSGELNVKYVIWRQRIWHPGGGWEYMEDRGSATANHYDHVHVSVR